MRNLMRKNGQISIEYAGIITCVIAALIAMQFYVKRAVQGRLREAADQIGRQYEPGSTKADFVTIVTRDILTQVVPDWPVQLYINEEGEEVAILTGTSTFTLETTNEDRTERVGYEAVGP